VIPAPDARILRQRFNQELTSRLRLDFFTQKQSAIVVPGRFDCVFCPQAQSLLEELAALSPRIALTVHDAEADKDAVKAMNIHGIPATVIRGQANRPISFYGIPSGKQFIPFVEVMIDAARGAVELSDETRRFLRRLTSDLHLRILVTTTCPYSPLLMHLVCKLALWSSRIKAEIVEAAEFPALAQRYRLRATPATIINDHVLFSGQLDEAMLIDALRRVVQGKSLDDIRPGIGMPFELPEPPQPQGQPTERQTASGLILPP
jgi:glutaredoxin-like protein